MNNLKRLSWSLAIATAMLLALPTLMSANVIVFNSASVYFDNYGVGIYNGTVDGTPAQFICDDFYTEINGGQSWNATVGNTNPVTSALLFDPSDISIPLPGTVATQQEDYNMIGYLADQIFMDPTNASDNWGNLSFAIWSVNDSVAYNTTLAANIGPQVNALLTTAYAFRDTPTNLTVYTPNPSDAGQEFLRPSAAPEPNAAWLLLAGLGLMASGWRRKHPK